MQISMWINGFIDWVSVPPDVRTDDAEFEKAKKRQTVKPAQNGGWLMRVTKTANTHADVNSSEEEIVQVILQEMTRGDRRTLTRKEAILRLVTRHQLQHLCHRSHIDHIEVDDDGPKPRVFDSIMEVHFACGNLQEEDLEELRVKYLEPTTKEELAAFLETSLGVKKERSEKKRAELQELREGVAKALEHHHTMTAAKRAAEEGSDS